MSTVDAVRAWLLGPARDEYWKDREGGRSDAEPFAWAAARLSEELLARNDAERLLDVERTTRVRIESWLRNAGPSLVGKCKTVGEVCDKLSEYIARGVY
jgi:hypothetical protein